MSRKLLLGLPLGFFVLGFLPSQQTGIGPGNPLVLGMPGCGGCHFGWMNGLPGGNNLAISVVPSSRTMPVGGTISITTSATGGDPDPKQWGGFCGYAESTTSRGTFVPGVRSRNFSITNDDITHTTSDTMGQGRTWTFGYKAHATNAGLVNIYMAVNTVNGDMSEKTGDNWGFHGFDSAAQDSTPIRLYVNANGVTGKGTACVGGFDQFPVLGSRTVPAVGNANFTIEAAGLPPAAPAVLLLASNPAWAALDLTIIGVTGCKLEVDPSQISINTTTSPTGIARKAEGKASIGIPIPNDTSLRGQKFDAQLVVVDAASGRPTPVTLTNGLTITVQ